MEGEDNEEIVREWEVHTRWEGRERIIGVATRDAKRFLCLCDQGRTIGLAGHKKETITPGQLYSAINYRDHEPHLVRQAWDILSLFPTK